MGSTSQHWRCIKSISHSRFGIFIKWFPFGVAFLHVISFAYGCCLGVVRQSRCCKQFLQRQTAENHQRSPYFNSRSGKPKNGHFTSQFAAECGVLSLENKFRENHRFFFDSPCCPKERKHSEFRRAPHFANRPASWPFCVWFAREFRDGLENKPALGQWQIQHWPLSLEKARIPIFSFSASTGFESMGTSSSTTPAQTPKQASFLLVIW